MRNYLAHVRAKYGQDRFELCSGLRSARDNAERLLIAHLCGLISDDEYRAKLREEAHREIDEQMLQTHFANLEMSLQSYADILQAAGDWKIASLRGERIDLAVERRI